MTPRRVQQYMQNYGADVPITCMFEKFLLESEATHIDNREDHIVHQGFMFIRKHFEKQRLDISRVDSRLWDMKRYKRVKPRKYDTYKERKNYSTSSSLVTSSSVVRSETNIPMVGLRRPVQQVQSPGPRSRPETDPVKATKIKTANPVFAQVKLAEMIEFENNQHSTKSSDEIKNHPTANYPADEYPQVPSRGMQMETPDLPYDPRAQRYQQAGSSSLQGNSISRRGVNYPNTNSPQLQSGQFPQHYDHQSQDKQIPGFAPSPGSIIRQPLGMNDMGIPMGVGQSPPWAMQPLKRAGSQTNPGTSHLDHFSNPYLRKQPSHAAHTPTLQPVSSHHQALHSPQPTRSQQAAFDDDDLSVFLDDRYKHFEGGNDIVNGTLNLDDSMVQDLNALNTLLKAKPKHN